MSLGQALPEQYQSQLQEKIQKTQAQFAEFGTPELEVFESPKSGFRMRAEFKVWHEGDDSFYAMYKPGEYKKPVKIEQFTIGSETIQNQMPLLIKEINQCDILRKRLFQVEFLTTTTGESLITLIYHKPLNDDWLKACQTLSKVIPAKFIGRSRKQKVTLSEDFVTETFDLNVGQFSYQQVETGFTQPNASVCQSMLNWATDVSKGLEGDLLELYCGNGNFTLPLAKNFNQVLATEVSKTSVYSGHYNIKQNNVDNITIARLSSEEFTQAINKEREFNRLRNIDLDDYNFTTVFVDPPRAGLDQDTVKMVQNYDQILYISCNPDTLAENLNTLTKTHAITRFALFDQFPYTDHRECGVLLRRNQ